MRSADAPGCRALIGGRRALAALAMLWLLHGLAPAAAQSLPRDVQIERSVVALERAIRADDHGETLSAIDALRRLDAAAAGGELRFFEARAAFARGDVLRAHAALVAFLTGPGRASPFYPAALELMLDIEPAMAEAAERAEQALGLTREQIRLIRFFLHQRYVGGWTAPEPIGTRILLEEERDRLVRFLGEIRSAPRRHLDRATAQRVLAEGFTPRRPSYPAGARRIGDWHAYRSGSDCVIATPARAVSPGILYSVPEMRFTVSPRTEGDRLGIALAEPLHLDPGQPITLAVGNERFALEESNGVLIPQAGQNRPRTLATRAMTGARSVRVVGNELHTGRTVEIAFDVARFGEALRDAYTNCNRPVLAVWIEDPRAPTPQPTPQPQQPTNPAPPRTTPAPSVAERVAEDHCLVIVASRQTLPETRAKIGELPAAARPQTRVYLSGNGWFAISIGAVPRPEARDRIVEEAAAGNIPDDSFCLDPARLVRELTPGEYAQVFPESAPTHRVVVDGLLNLRGAPGNDGPVIDRLDPGRLIRVRGVDDRGWADVVLVDGRRGFAYSRFLEPL